MKYQNLRKKTEGFTIIEVLIVLAIAGLILLIVFLAVPALQRNSRNTQRKNEISIIAGAVNEYTGNTNGKLPSTTTEQGNALGNAKLNFYSGQVTWASAATATVANATTDSTAVVVTSAKCGGASGWDAVQASSRQFVVLYTVEGGTAVKQCTEG